MAQNCLHCYGFNALQISVFVLLWCMNRSDNIQYMHSCSLTWPLVWLHYVSCQDCGMLSTCHCTWGQKCAANLIRLGTLRVVLCSKQKILIEKMLKKCTVYIFETSAENQNHLEKKIMVYPFLRWEKYWLYVSTHCSKLFDGMCFFLFESLYYK